MRKLVRVFLDHGIEALDFGLQVSTWEPKENDACMEEPLVEDQLTEIAVGNQQNALLVPGDRKDILIGKTMRVVAGRRPKRHGQAYEGAQSAGNRRSGRRGISYGRGIGPRSLWL